MVFKTNEIPMVSELLGQFDISDSAITVDALHTQRTAIEHLVGRGGHVVMTVQKNQPTAHDELKALRWKDIDGTLMSTAPWLIDTACGAFVSLGVG